MSVRNPIAPVSVRVELQSNAARHPRVDDRRDLSPARPATMADVTVADVVPPTLLICWRTVGCWYTASRPRGPLWYRGIPMVFAAAAFGVLLVHPAVAMGWAFVAEPVFAAGQLALGLVWPLYVAYSAAITSARLQGHVLWLCRYSSGARLATTATSRALGRVAVVAAAMLAVMAATAVLHYETPVGWSWLLVLVWTWSCWGLMVCLTQPLLVMRATTAAALDTAMRMPNMEQRDQPSTPESMDSSTSTVLSVGSPNGSNSASWEHGRGAEPGLGSPPRAVSSLSVVTFARRVTALRARLVSVSADCSPTLVIAVGVNIAAFIVYFGALLVMHLQDAASTDGQEAFWGAVWAIGALYATVIVWVLKQAANTSSAMRGMVPRASSELLRAALELRGHARRPVRGDITADLYGVVRDSHRARANGRQGTEAVRTCSSTPPSECAAVDILRVATMHKATLQLLREEGEVRDWLAVCGLRISQGTAARVGSALFSLITFALGNLAL